MAIKVSIGVLPTTSKTASTPSGASSATRASSPLPYVVGLAPHVRSMACLGSLAVPITRAPRATAICTATDPTPPGGAVDEQRHRLAQFEAVEGSNGSLRAVPAPAASSHDHCAGLGAQTSSTTRSA
jgi:hypothetical protein